MKKVLIFATPVLAAGLFFSCTTDIESAEDILSRGDSSSSLVSSSVETDNYPSSSGIEQPSSSSVELSSSSAMPSSSSEAESSSSFEPSSSSYVSLCAGFVDGTEREHYGKMKKQFCDERDGKRYVYAVIGTQTWIAEDLNYNPGAGNSTCYGNSSDNCNIYGRMYYWSTAMALPPSCNSAICSSQIQAKHQGICPSGWHIPSKAEWDAMTTYIGGSNIEGKRLRATSRWSNCSLSGSLYLCEDTYGFSALPGGHGGSDGSFGGVGSDGRWWTATESSSGVAYRRHMQYNSESAGWNTLDKSSFFNVRCIKNY